MNGFSKIFPWVTVGVAALYLVYVAASGGRGHTVEGFDLDRYGAIPVVERGREKPLDTVARIYLMTVSGRQTVEDEVKVPGQEEPDTVRRPAIKWLLDLMTSFAVRGEKVIAGPATEQKVFRITNEDVLQLLGLEPRSGFRYSLSEFSERLKDKNLYDALQSARDKKKRDLYETKLLEFGNQLEVVQKLADLQTPLVIPPTGKGGEWSSLNDLMTQGGDIRDSQFALAHVLLLQAYEKNDPKLFNEVLGKFDEILGKTMAPAWRNAKFEISFNRLAPFYQCTVLYVFVFILACGSWLVWPDSLNKAAFWLCAFTFCIHTWAIIARMSIQGRPPVTNLYSSAVFIGWGAVGVGLFLEWIYRNGVANAVGAVVGALTLIVGHYLSLDGDTLEMMQAVLDTNFWLATHVTCITLGYTATFVAGTLGSAYVLLGVCTKALAQREIALTDGATPSIATPMSGDIGGKLTKMTYGVICFAMFLSFTGTVLGGIWADQSWGRFWGWDPKENGALLIVIWNALILHARWAGMIKARGLAQLAIFGDCVTAWSWFGTNLLGVGLHSYGFMQGAMTWLLIYVMSQLALIALGSLPLNYWRSFAKPTTPLPA